VKKKIDLCSTDQSFDPKMLPHPPSDHLHHFERRLHLCQVVLWYVDNSSPTLLWHQHPQHISSHQLQQIIIIIVISSVMPQS
jgi:hypothetical protein